MRSRTVLLIMAACLLAFCGLVYGANTLTDWLGLPRDTGLRLLMLVTGLAMLHFGFGRGAVWGWFREIPQLFSLKTPHQPTDTPPGD